MFRAGENMFKVLKEIINEHISYKSQITSLAKVDINKNFKGSGLGWVWAFVKPTMTIFVFWFAITIGFRGSKNIDGIICPYFLWLVVGMVTWFYMRDMIYSGASCFRRYKHLVTKIKFPVSIIPTFVSLSNLYSHILLMAGVIVLFFCFGFPPSVYWLQLPLYTAFMLMFTIVWSMATGLLSVVSRDFHNMLKAMVSAIFWLSGILFDVNSIPYEWIRVLFYFNPVTYIVEGYRNCFTRHVWFFEQWQQMLCFLFVLFAFVMLALWLYKRLRKEIPDVL